VRVGFREVGAVNDKFVLEWVWGWGCGEESEWMEESRRRKSCYETYMVG
jgi:hypothetical protein